MPTPRLKPPQLVAVETAQGPLLVPCVVRRVRGARRIRLRAGADRQALLTVPYGVAEAEALRFLRGQGDWLLQAWQRTPPRRTIAEWLRRHPVLALGGQATPALLETVRGRPGWRVESDPGRVRLQVTAGSPESPQLWRVLRALAKSALPDRARLLANRVGVAIGPVQVRDQRSRWGSCSRRGALSLNWRLILLPPELQDHVLLHELAHRTHLDHSDRFWDLLARYDPDWKTHDRALDRLGRELFPLVP